MTEKHEINFGNYGEVEVAMMADLRRWHTVPLTQPKKMFPNIAHLIRTRRLNHPKGLSQSDVSHIVDYKNGQFISNVERGLCSIPAKKMQVICDTLLITRYEIETAIIEDYKLYLRSIV